MNHISKVCGWLLPLLFSLNTVSLSAQDDEWRLISFQDFGGNAATDPLFSSTKISGEQGTSSIGFTAGSLSSIATQYSLGKYAPETGKPTGWVSGGDHTHPEDRNKGYFLMLNCPPACGVGTLNTNCTTGYLDYSENYIYQKTLSQNLCSGVTFKFEAWVTNMLDEEQNVNGSFITLGVYDANGKIKELPATNAIPACGYGATELNWQKIEFVFDVPATADLSEINFRIYPVGAEGSGFDFGLDDIAIYIKQPSVSFGTPEFNYKEPATLTAALSDNSFFASMDNVKFYWEYSVDGETGWTEVGGTRSYSQYKNFEYTIDSFDKDNRLGNGNGYYRLNIATSENIGSLTDNSVCCIRAIYPIKETKNKVRLRVCENGSETLDGVTFTKADDGLTKTTSNNFEVTTEVIFNKVQDETQTICIGHAYPPGSTTIYNDPVKNLKLAEDITPSKRLNFSGETCDSITKVTYLNVVDKDTIYNEPEDVCVGKQASNGEIYATEQEVKLLDPQECLIYVNTIRVHPTYNIVESRNVCEGFTYNGRVYSEGEYDLPTTKHQTSQWYCDSVETIHIIVAKHSEGFLEDIEVCQSDAGAGKPAYEFGGHKYMNTTKKIMEFDAHDTIPGGSALGCDSIVTQHVTIYPLMHEERDTLICRDQILFGQEWTVAGKYDKDLTFKSQYGCDSVITYHINVLQIQLKLRTEFDKNAVCDGEAATIIVNLLPSDVPLRWEPELTSRNPLRPVVSPEVTTTYVCHAENNVGCHATDSIPIEVNPIPVLVIDSVDEKERSVTFNVSGGTPEYRYWLGTKERESDGSKLENVVYGKHAFRVVDTKGCAAEDTINMEPRPIKPALFLSPNGDGVNDSWIIEGIEAYNENPGDVKVRIYSRFGKLVYESDGYDNETGFNGEADGAKLPSTDYWYVIDLESVDKQYVGHFTLLR